MLFSFVEVAFTISLRGFIKLVLSSDSVYNSATRSGSNEDCKHGSNCKHPSNPGLREFHLCMTPFVRLNSRTGYEQKPADEFLGNRNVLGQIVNLQANRVSASAFDSVDDFYDITVFRRTRRLY